MKLAISNIAWETDEDEAVAETLNGLGVRYLEIAPTKLWEEPIEASDADIEKVNSFWLSYGIGIVAFQSMLFKHPDLEVFGNNSDEALSYLTKFTDLAGRMGVSAMVFGSPKNRLAGNVPIDKAYAKAIDFFGALGKTGEKNNVSFCIEPNPEQYNCDFITRAQEGYELVKAVNSPGFKLHLDMAGMTLAGDDIDASIKNSADVLSHFHVSAPFLEQVEASAKVNYAAAALALKEIDYKGYISIEMRPGEPGTNAQRVKKAVEFTQSVFGAT